MSPVHTSGTTNGSKYCTAVYRVRIPWYDDMRALHIELPLMLGSAYGRSRTYFGANITADEHAEFYVLDNNDAQTTRADIVNKLQAYGIVPDQPWDEAVQVAAAVPSRGHRPHEGSPRAGTTHVLGRAPHASAKVAQ